MEQTSTEPTLCVLCTECMASGLATITSARSSPIVNSPSGIHPEVNSLYELAKNTTTSPENHITMHCSTYLARMKEMLAQSKGHISEAIWAWLGTADLQIKGNQEAIESACACEIPCGSTSIRVRGVAGTYHQGDRKRGKAAAI